MKKLLSYLSLLLILVCLIACEDSSKIKITPITYPEPEPETPNYIAFTATSGTVDIGIKAENYGEVPPAIYLQYSFDKISWSDFTTQTSINVGNENKTVYIQAKDGIVNNSFCTVSGECFGVNCFTTTSTDSGTVSLSGNIMSLLDNTGNKKDFTSENNYAFLYLFLQCNNIIDAGSLLLPATTLVDCCYCGMFSICTSLTSAPALPATTLAVSCYSSMFSECSSLTEAPALPATTLAVNCYYNMFSECSSLTAAPALPATSLADWCYNEMFKSCTNLTSAPALPATTLAENCYFNMFYACTNLTTAPALPATTLAENCYYFMFSNCTSLTSAPALPATTLADFCYCNMFYNCSSLTSAPALPATILAGSCYRSMFSGCSSLTSAPALPATSLTDYCYTDMFQSCSSLTSAPALPATTLTDYCYWNMFKNCSSLKITTNSNYGTKIFTCPSTLGRYYSVVNMFDEISTASDFTGTPSSGFDYYWYTDN